MPIYNTRHEWLKRAVDSIVSQTVNEWELIMVDDGSEAITADFIDWLAERDGRITVIHKENQGVSSARNCGIDIANTPWITFFDADDWIENNYVEKLLDVLDGHPELEILTYGYDDIYGEQVIQNLWGAEEYHKFTTLDKIGMQMSLLQETKGLKDYPMFFGAPWNMVISLDFINRHHIRYETKLRKSEDSVFNLYATEYASEIGYYNNVLYHYFHNDESANGTKFSRNTDNIVLLLEAYKKFIHDTGKDDIEVYREAYKKNLLLRFDGMLKKTFLNECNNDSLQVKISGIRHILESEPYSSSLKECDGKGLDRNKRILLFAMKHRWCLFIVLLSYARKLSKRIVGK